LKRQTLTFDDGLEKAIEDWRARQRPIPSFSEAIETLLKEALKK